MIKNWILTGDTHSRVSARIEKILHDSPELIPEETAIIILGDAGFNFFLNKTDGKQKHKTSELGCVVYCVRGNHEERPENLGYPLVFDPEVQGEVYIEGAFPNIKYFKDGGVYNINGHRTLVIGGAYSVDKGYRLAAAGLTEATNEPKKSGWFKDELLTEDEMSKIASDVFLQDFDFVFSHTCPLSWEPTDLFLSFIDQSSVNKSMEQWLDVIKADIHWGVWCFGHFHADRIERPRVQQFYVYGENIETIWNRWFNEKTIENERWFRKSPNYYMEESK